MRNKTRISRMLMALGVVLLAVVMDWQTGTIAPGLLTEQPAEQRAQQPGQECPSAAALMSPQKEHRQEATLTDATSLYRICSSRPQRLLPSHGSKSERTAGPSGCVRRHIVKPLQFLHDSRRRQESAPFCLSASCLYYVIALRHIIR